MRKMMPDRSHDDRLPDLVQNLTALFQKCRNKTFASMLHFVDGTLSTPAVDKGFPRFVIFVTVFAWCLVASWRRFCDFDRRAKQCVG
jgi:hypothetical protein